MSYPAAPWRLKGYGLQTLHLVDIDRIRHLVPAHLKIFSCFPGKTLGSLYVGRYEAESTLHYSELIAVPALIHHQGKVGVWISHIYVDNPDSVVGGREIWGLPKERAEFHWEGTTAVTVRQDDRTLCQLRSTWQLPEIGHPIQVPAFSLVNQQLAHFSGRGKVKWQWAGIDLHIAPPSSLASLAWGQPWLTIQLSALDLNVGHPVF
jgi:acetoacetate decarboxylase